MIRFFSLLTAIVTAFLTGCAIAPLPGVQLGGQGTYFGRHGVISVGGASAPSYGYNPGGVTAAPPCPANSYWDGRGCRIVQLQRQPVIIQQQPIYQPPPVYRVYPGNNPCNNSPAGGRLLDGHWVCG